MPVSIDELLKGNVAKPANPMSGKLWSPKYFDSELTGFRTTKGKLSSVGLLGEAANPSAVKPGIRKLIRDHIDAYRRVVTNRSVTTHFIPLDVMTEQYYALVDTLPLPRPEDSIPLANEVHAKIPHNIYLALDVHSVVFEKERTASGGLATTLYTTWRCMLVDNCTGTNADPEVMYLKQPKTELTPQLDRYLRTQMQSTSTHHNKAFVFFASDIAGVIDTCLDTIAAANWSTDPDTTYAAFTGVCTYDLVCKASHRWQTEIDKVIDDAAARVASITPDGPNSTLSVQLMSEAMHRLEAYPVTLNFYEPIYQSLERHFSPEVVKELVKRNLNLLLTDTMTQLNAVKPQLNTCPVNSNAQVDPFYSTEQTAAIQSHEPLILIQASAGTGKSSTIKGRIDYMVQSGIEPGDIMVLSFTNAAADHIRNICPGVHSMTIASMVHSIYSQNFAHELSSIPTLLNALDIHYPHSALASTFKLNLKAVQDTEPDAFTRLNNFVEDNYDHIVQMLDTCGQTTLELEIILCYQHIGDYVEPPEVASKHLIVDEVQDNSIFDFVYTLEYVVKHKESLYIVGDASQTLFEFRGANPRAINIMEASGVFATYKLQINYRSTQDILDFANVALADIEANQFAHLRLKANDRTPVTAESFQNSVQLKTVQVDRQVNFFQNIPNYVKKYLAPYITSCLNKGEHVCVLAYSKRELNALQKAVQDLFPACVIENIAPKRVYDTTVLSAFIARDWTEVRFLDFNNLATQIAQTIVHNIQNYVPGRQYKKDGSMNPAFVSAIEQVRAWHNTSQNYVAQLVQATRTGTITVDEMLGRLQKQMLSFEIKQNSIHQNMMSQRNRDHKAEIDWDKTDIVFSTIHSAKGLEFDNVIIVYHDRTVQSEDTKRLYYVALTRAMRSEFVLNWTTDLESNLEDAYQDIVCELSGGAAQDTDAAQN